MRATQDVPCGWPARRADQRTLQRAVQALSEHERAAAWADGAAMPLEQALDFALATAEPAPSGAGTVAP